MTAESVVRSGGNADVIRGCLFLLVVWCRLACIVEMVVAAQQQLSQYYIVLLVVPFFLRPLLDGVGVCSYWAGLYLFILWKAEERERQRYNIRKKPGIEPSISRRWCTPIVVVVVPPLPYKRRRRVGRTDRHNRITHMYTYNSPGSRVDLSLWYVPLSYPLFSFYYLCAGLIGIYRFIRSLVFGGCDIANDSRE
jgi:hypothetical protein